MRAAETAAGRKGKGLETFFRDLRISASFSSRVRHTGATWRNGRRLSLSAPLTRG